MAGEAPLGPNSDMLALMHRLSQSDSGDGGGGGGFLGGFLRDANICWWSIAATAPGGLFEIQLAYLVGFGKTRGFSTKYLDIIKSMGDGFLKNIATGVASSSFSDLGHLHSGLGAPSGGAGHEMSA